MKIYFAGSIRGGRDDQKIYGEVIKLLSRYGSVLTELVGNKDLTYAGESLPNDAIYQRDIAWLTEADIVVAEVSTPSLGVGYEIAKAENMGKRVLCIYRPAQDGRRLSAMIGGDKNVVNREYGTVGDLEPIFADFFKN